MRIALAQLDPIVGAFETNVKKLKEAYLLACQTGARLLVTPELSLCGYPPHDLVERSEMFERNDKALSELMALTQGQSCALAVGHIGKNPKPVGRFAQNFASVLENGKEVHRHAKMLLPTYDVFDEARYFEPGTSASTWICDGVPIAIAICEDLWARDEAFERQIYGHDPVEQFKKLNAKLLISLSASPYEWKKRERREKIHSEIAAKLQAPLVYVNQVGATDEILFDGASFVCDAQGKFLGRFSSFRTGFGVLDLPVGPESTGVKGLSPSWLREKEDVREDQAPEEIEVLTRALVTGIRDYFTRTGFKTAILGLSGGIDSAVVATLAMRALGPENVMGIAMPSQFSSHHSLEDAEALARNLKIRYAVRPIKFIFSQASREISELTGTLAPVALENLQARLRAQTLLTLSNHFNALVLTTGNKSELATGYCTLYGDMCGAIAPIGDLYKTRVYELARYLNQAWGALIPERSITKAPSAELKPEQTDQDTLPPYKELDKMLEAYIEHLVPVSVLEKSHGDWVRKIIRLVELNEFKRRQAAPVLKISTKAFGIGRRLPIAKTWT